MVMVFIKAKDDRTYSGQLVNLHYRNCSDNSVTNFGCGKLKNLYNMVVRQ